MNKNELLLNKNVGEEVSQAIKNIWPVSSIQAHDRYLDLSSFVRHSKSVTFQDFRSRIWNKL